MKASTAASNSRGRVVKDPDATAIDLDDPDLNSAAVKIQAAQRGKSGRKEFQEKQAEKEETVDRLGLHVGRPLPGESQEKIEDELKAKALARTRRWGLEAKFKAEEWEKREREARAAALAASMAAAVTLDQPGYREVMARHDAEVAAVAEAAAAAWEDTVEARAERAELLQKGEAFMEARRSALRLYNEAAARTAADPIATTVNMIDTAIRALASLPPWHPNTLEDLRDRLAQDRDGNTGLGAGQKEVKGKLAKLIDNLRNIRDDLDRSLRKELYDEQEAVRASARRSISEGGGGKNTKKKHTKRKSKKRTKKKRKKKSKTRRKLS